MSDHPFNEIISSVEELLKNPHNTIYQKFTCTKCNSRQTISTPNTIYKLGRCEECNSITNIENTGCNYLLMIEAKP